jgi:hypothetical protein
MVYQMISFLCFIKYLSMLLNQLSIDFGMKDFKKSYGK